MRDYNIIDDELFDEVVVENTEGKSEEQIKKEIRVKKTLKGIRIALYALMGAAAARLFYKTSDEKEKNTDYLDRF